MNKSIQTLQDYNFVLIKNLENTNFYHPIVVEKDICNESYIFKQSELAVYKDITNHKRNIVIDDIVLNPTQHYLIQTTEMGNFGQYCVGKPVYIFENQIEVEQDIYHYYFMQFSG